MNRALTLYSQVRARRRAPEASLQIAVCGHLRLRGVPGLIYFAPCNEGKRSAREAGWLKQKGMLPGVSDLVIIIPGLPVAFLELKAKGQKQSPEQVAFGACCLAARARYAVADNIDSAIAILELWGAIRAGASTRRQEMAADEQRRAG